jgi:hypothetical protein
MSASAMTIALPAPNRQSAASPPCEVVHWPAQGSQLAGRERRQAAGLRSRPDFRDLGARAGRRLELQAPVIEQGLEEPDRGRPANVAERELRRPGQHRIGEDQRIPAASHPCVERHQLGRRQRPRLCEQQQLAGAETLSLQHVEMADRELPLQHAVGRRLGGS